MQPNPGKRLTTGLKMGTGVRITQWAAAMAMASALTHVSYAADEDDPVWRDFTQALGQPALIGTNADHALANNTYRPIPAFSQSDLNADKLRLGFDLFHERRLSVDNSVGCNSCHSGMFGGTDGRQVSEGANGVLGKLNAPTTFNAGFNFRQFWDGRAVTLEEQALGPIENELEMAHDLTAVLEILKRDADYPAEFAKVYPDGVSVANMADAIAYFQRVNFTRAGTPFVRHLEGEEGQLSEQALKGWQRFDEVGCSSCHNGINLGGNSYQQMGSMFSYFEEHRAAGPNDIGLMGRSERSNDEHVFKVPTLHGVAETAPYFHNGSVETLELAIEEMGEHQLGRMLSQQDIDDIAAFLRSLGGRPMGGMAMGAAGMGRGMGMSGGMSNGGMQGGGMQGRGMGGGMSGGMSGGMHQEMHGGAGMHAGASNTAASETVTAAATAQDPVVSVANPEQQALHHSAYLTAISNADAAKEKLLTEMRRIQSGEVAHFDFLQFQHLELIRHARALQYPPSDLAADKRAQLTGQAQQLLAAANALEWTISDYLRAEAMSKVMQKQIEQPETGDLEGLIGDATARLEENRNVAAQMLTDMQASPISTLSAELGQMYSSTR
ncbi:MAG: cytochrome c peroxidase [Pseudohongiella sp.]|nr:cytochrome c peroxidase [Pseudohongiella sp.]